MHHGLATITTQLQNKLLALCVIDEQLECLQDILAFETHKKQLIVSYLSIVKIFMKKLLVVVLSVFVVCGFSSCGIFGGGNKNGCPSNGRNIGAEKLAAGDPKAVKAARKAPKFKGGKF